MSLVPFSFCVGSLVATAFNLLFSLALLLSSFLFVFLCFFLIYFWLHRARYDDLSLLFCVDGMKGFFKAWHKGGTTATAAIMTRHRPERNYPYFSSISL